jgi:signal transduction histidine kinase
MITAAKRRDRINVAVRDNGIGIPDNVLRNLFRIDYTYTSPGTAREKGTGLGLILCKEFIEKHGQSISVKSKVGYGSEFIFTMRVADSAG